MFSFIEKHPFLSGCIAGVIAVRIIRKKMEGLFDGKITIVQLDLSGISLTGDSNKDEPEEDESPDAQEENSEEN